MKKGKVIFYLVYFTFNVIFFLSALFVDYKVPQISNPDADFEELVKLLPLVKYIPFLHYLKWFALAGLLLFIIDVIMVGINTHSSAKAKESLENEVNSLKAKLFDLQEAATNSAVETTPHHDEDESEAGN